ncbi:hypothetical protein H0H92_013884 [Tricholoma furcatifolium]|nr:hypothetical protein H0H92_013884 [Tricholoma furcatifolium]
MFLSLLPLLLLLTAHIAPATASNHGHGISRLPRHHDLSERIARSPQPDTNAPSRPKRVRNRRATCRPRPASSSAAPPSDSTPSTTASASSSSSAESTTSTDSTPAPTSGSTGNILGVAFKPADWPTATQAGAAPTSTVASTSDPYLMELSKASNNADNALYTEKHVGQMTYYGQGLGACGDTYNDSSFTAAVSHLMYDAWPGASEETNRNPICGPYVSGRKVIDPAGSFVTAVTDKFSASTFVNLGGDGLLDCASGESQCHIPLTATVTHGGKSIIVQIVDRCAACAEGDIDLTPTAFSALADMALGRTDVVWWFNQY